MPSNKKSTASSPHSRTPIGSSPTADRPRATAPGATSTSQRIKIETLENASLPLYASYYLCGPDSFMRDLSAGLTARGVTPECVATETFGSTTVIAVPGLIGTRPAPHQPDGPPGQGSAITFSRSNLTVPWDPTYASLLELAEACDVPVSFGCRTGVCHTCETGLLTGEVAYSTAPLEPPANGRVLVCCTKPDTELTLEL